MIDSLSSELMRVYQESIKLGTRSVTVSLESTKTLKIHLEPEKERISDLRVFLAHATADRAWADEVNELLTEVGFKVTYLRATEDRSPGDRWMSDNEVSQMLSRHVDDADYLCMLFSKNSSPREWVRQEFKMAARLIGRVVMLKDQSVASIKDFQIPRFERRALLTVKYQILDYKPDDPEMGIKLARVIINNPDEGVTDGRDRPLVIRERNLKRENALRRFVRLRLDDYDEYRSRHVTDILPFSWRELGINVGDVRGAFQWFVRKHGRLNLEVQAAFKRVGISILSLPTEDSIRDWTDEPMIFAIIVWKKEWDAQQEALSNRGWI